MSDSSSLDEYKVVCSEVSSELNLEMKVEIWIKPVLPIPMVILIMPPNNFGITLEEWKRLVDEFNAEAKEETNATN